MHPTDDPMLTVADVAAHIGASEYTVKEWIKRGELTASKHGSRIGYRIRQSDYEAFLARRTLTSAISRQLLTTSVDR
ncbi:MAG: helix-turn-helix domain-containing protein [Caldilineaceae bacterium]|nr:helix-turn-helix domain-containing protein [Caldilineaceae bacterium]